MKLTDLQNCLDLPCFQWEMGTGRSAAPWPWRSEAGERGLMLIEKEVFEIENLKNEPFPMAVLLLQGLQRARRG